VKLAGKHGPIATYVQSQNRASTVPYPWHATAGDLIQLLGADPQRQALVVDLKPGVVDNVSLYRLLDVWGFSDKNWTPLALRFISLFVDREEANPVAFKNSFVDDGSGHNWVGEFLYVRGGVHSGSWNWGMVGRVNGALLWPEAFAFLSKSLAETVPVK
jgi:hypothetical protein